MPQSIKNIFYHALLARAAYSEMKSNDLQDWILLKMKQVNPPYIQT